MRNTVRSTVANKAAVARLVSSATKPRRSGSLLKFLGITGENRLGYLRDDDERRVKDNEAGVTSSERTGVGSPFRSPTKGPRFARTPESSGRNSGRRGSISSPALVKALTLKLKDKISRKEKKSVRRDISNAWNINNDDDDGHNTAHVVENNITNPIIGNLDMLRRVLPGIGFKVGHLCTICRKPVSESQIRKGWSQNNLTELSIGGSHETTCPHAKTNKTTHTFVPALMVASSSCKWNGTHGPATPLMCKYLSPWAMYAQINALVLRRKAFRISFKSRFKKQHAELFWNLCMYTFEARLPFGFLLLSDDDDDDNDDDITATTATTTTVTTTAKPPETPPPNVNGLQWRGRRESFQEFQNDEKTDIVRPIERWQACVARLRLLQCLDSELIEYSVNALLRPEAHFRLDVAITLCVLLIRTIRNHLVDKKNSDAALKSFQDLLKACRESGREDCDMLEEKIQEASRMGVYRVMNGFGSRVLACARWHLKQLQIWKKEYEQTKSRILMFYVRFEPKSLEEDPDFLNKKLKDYEGKETVLLDELLAKYGSQMVASRPAPAVPTPSLVKSAERQQENSQQEKTKCSISSIQEENRNSNSSKKSSTTNTTMVEKFWEDIRKSDKTDDVQRACLLYEIKEMLSYVVGFNEEMMTTKEEELTTPHESAEHLNARYILSREALVESKKSISINEKDSSEELLPHGWGIHFDGVFENQFFYHSNSEYSTWKRPQSGTLMSHMMEDSAAELMEIVRSVCDHDARVWVGISKDDRFSRKVQRREWQLRVPELKPRTRNIRIPFPEHAKKGDLVRVLHEGAKYDVPIPVDAKSTDSNTFLVAFPIRETVARRFAHAFEKVLKYQCDGLLLEMDKIDGLVEKELREHNMMLNSVPGKIRVVVDRLLSLFWL